MNKIVSLLVAASLSLSVGLAEAASQPPASQPSIARVNGTPIPYARFEMALKLAVAQGGSDTPELRNMIKGQLVAQELLRQEALKKKLQNDPLVVAARDEAGNRAMIERYVATAVKPQAVTDVDIRARYDAILASLGEREYKPSLIAVATENEARDILGRLKRNEGNFADLARTHSKLVSRNAGGAMDWLSFPLPAAQGRTAGLPLGVAQALAALTPGAISAEPIAADGAFWIVRLEESRATQIPDYAAVQPALRRALETQALEQASAALMQRLVANARIE